MVDHPALALARWWSSSISWMISRQGVGRRSRRRRSADSSPGCGSGPSCICGTSPGCSGMRSSSTMISVPSRSTTGRSAGEVERHDRDVLQVDVLPDVELGPVREREDADALALGACGCCRAARAPGAGSSGPSGAGRSGTRRSAPWRGASPRRAARRRRPRRSRTCRAPASAPRSSTCRCAARAVVERVDAARHRLRVLCGRAAPCRARGAIRSRISYIARNFQVVSTCSSGNGGLARVERLHRQVQHHRASPCRSNRASPGCSHSATTSRMMWMLSASRRCRWVSMGADRTPSAANG